MTLKATIACVVLAAVTAAAQAPAPKQAQKPSAAEDKPRFKAIWEPVPFDKDINLNAIACTGPETCWVVGDKSTILFTNDGGTKWQVQLGGDPESTDEKLSKIFFLDATHGWVMTDGGKILGTTDGTSWAELAEVSGTSQGVWFVSPQSGIGLENSDSTTQSTVTRSEDGGKTWKPESRCTVNGTVGGLPRTLQCRLSAAQFLSPTVGFVGGAAAVNMSTNAATFGTTADGGRTWTMKTIPDATRNITSVTFWTETDGIAVLSDGEEVQWTSDGGATWTRSVKQRVWPSVYGVGDGKIIVGIGQSGGIGYSFNGGRNFTSRPLALPARAADVTFPDAQHGYLVGQHAMIYRYRIVPLNYQRPGMIAAMAP